MYLDTFITFSTCYVRCQQKNSLCAQFDQIPSLIQICNNNANYFFYSLIFFQSRLSDSNVSGEKTHLSLTDGLSVKGGEFSLRAVYKVCN